MSNTAQINDPLNPRTDAPVPSVQSGGLLQTSPSTAVANSAPASPAPVLQPSDVGMTQPTSSTPAPTEAPLDLPGVQPPPAVGPGGLENDSVVDELNGLLQTDSPFLQQARTRGLQGANERGLLNSSIAETASESAAITAAFPVAAQEAQQKFQKNLTRMGIAANDREKATAAVVAMANNYAEVFRTIASNENLPAQARNTFLTHISALRDSNFDMLQQLYGIELDWNAGAGASSIPPAPAAPTRTPPSVDEFDDPDDGD